ncbi:MAG: inositol phosphorylceramide synthase [Nocardioidaceae bacterium]|nr:inositol phosphorylceramide synthase [Nocardioidaceae bacterium]
MRSERLAFAVAQAVLLAIAAALVATIYGLPLRDPDGILGPTYVRLPAILAMVVVVDVVPRIVHRMFRAGLGLQSGIRRLSATTEAVFRERWSLDRSRFVFLGLGSWYLTYVAFRNLKGYVPFVNPGVDDARFAGLDRWIFLGHDPAVLLHELLGVGVAAHLMSFVYVAWLVFIPFSIAGVLIWGREASAGAWYVTAMGVDWVLGVATYYAFPTLGPVYSSPQAFASLPDTRAAALQTSMYADRAEVLADPIATHAVQSIAAFASLHVGMLMTACLIAHLLGLHRWVRRALWSFLALTVLATVYLGWHFFVDAVGGAAIGALAVGISAVATRTRIRQLRRGGARAAELTTAVRRPVG